MKTKPQHIWFVALSALVPLSACCSSGRASPPEPTPTDAPLDADSSIDRQVKELLAAYEHVPSADDWARIGTPEEVSASLMRIAAKPEGQTLAAARATSSLAHFPRPEVSLFLEQRLADPKTPVTLRGKAAIALAAGFGDVKAKVIAPLFTSADESLREDAARAFKRFVSPAAERFLDERLKVEPAPHIRAAMSDAKTQIASEREARTKANTYQKDLDQLDPIADPGPIR